MKYYLGYHRIFESVNFLNVNYDGGICTWYSTVVLLFSSILLATIMFAKIKTGVSNFIYWTVLSIVFLVLSIDESIGILKIPLDLLFANGHYQLKLVVPGALLAIIIGISYLKFLFNLPPKTCYLFLFAGIIFLTGSIGIEMFTNEYVGLSKYAYTTSSYDPLGMTYALISTFEEFLEMISIVIFIYALIDYINAHITRKISLAIQN